MSAKTCRCGKPAGRGNNSRRCAQCQKQHQTDAAGELVKSLYHMTIRLLDPPVRRHWLRTLYRFLAQRDGSDCALCGERVDIALPGGPKGDGLGPSVDHVRPRKHGGQDELDNLTLTHWRCNRQRYLSPHPSLASQ